MALGANTAKDARLDYEAGQSFTAMELLTDSGDHYLFTSAAASGLWSDRNGYSPEVYPNGLITGGVVGEDNAAVNDVVDVTGLTCYLVGVETVVGAGSATATRSANGALPYRITSIIVTAAGALDVIAGADGAAFSEVRAAAGGPPLITAGTIEIAQTRLASIVNAPIDAAEIFQVVGTHRERYDYPLWEVNYGPRKVSYGTVLTPTAVDGASVLFLTDLPLIHTGAVAKRVYAEYYEPIFAETKPVADFVPPDESFSSSSKQVYGGTIAAVSSSMGQGSFTAYFQDGITDPLSKLKGEKLWFRFYPNRYKAPYTLTQGFLGVSRSNPAGDSIQAACTIAATYPAYDVEA